MSLPAWEVTQERTFARWCTQHLKHKNLTIPDNDLPNSISDGVKLSYLLEELSKKSLKGVVATPSTRFQKLSNNSIALKFLSGENVKVTGIGPEDIVDAKRKLAMGLIWTLILNYQIASQPGGGDSAADTAKSDLLKWVQNQVKPFNVPCNNFTNDWGDGKVLCALVNSLKPNTINWGSVGGDKLENARQGIHAAETDLLIPRIMEPEDFANGTPDELSVVTYASLFRDAVNSGRLRQASHPPVQTAHSTTKGPSGASGTVELFLSLATSSLQVKKDIQSMKFLLDKKGVKYLEYDVGTNEAKKNEAFSKSGTRTLPQLFINGAYVGGYDEVQMLEECGELTAKLNP